MGVQNGFFYIEYSVNRILTKANPTNQDANQKLTQQHIITVWLKLTEFRKTKQVINDQQTNEKARANHWSRPIGNKINKSKTVDFKVIFAFIQLKPSKFKPEFKFQT